MPKKSNGRETEIRYLRRDRQLRSGRKKNTEGRTPWKLFFEKGAGAEMRTTIARQSIHSIVYAYGKKLGKRFGCSYAVDVTSGTKFTLVKIEAVTARDDE